MSQSGAAGCWGSRVLVSQSGAAGCWCHKVGQQGVGAAGCWRNRVLAQPKSVNAEAGQLVRCVHTTDTASAVLEATAMAKHGDCELITKMSQ